MEPVILDLVVLVVTAGATRAMVPTLRAAQLHLLRPPQRPTHQPIRSRWKPSRLCTTDKLTGPVTRRLSVDEAFFVSSVRSTERLTPFESPGASLLGVLQTRLQTPVGYPEFSGSSVVKCIETDHHILKNGRVGTTHEISVDT